MGAVTQGLQVSRFSVELAGIRPIMFDRYAGDNRTKLPTEDRMYLDANGGLVIPALNIFSMLCAENTRSVARLGPRNEAASRRQIAQGIAAYVSITPDDIPLLGGDKQQIVWAGKWSEQVGIHETVARVKGGIPNPKTRPVVSLPWSLVFEVEYVVNSDCTPNNLRESFAIGGKIGLGTFRPYFGRYVVAAFKEI